MSLTAGLFAVASVAFAILASMLMWWATKRNAMWAITAGVVLAFVIFLTALVIAWGLTHAAFPP
jgi:hypothetical protein